MHKAADSDNGSPHRCLSPNRLIEYLQGHLSEQEIEQVAAATQTCANCQQAMVTLEAEADELLNVVRHGMAAGEPWETSEELNDLLVAAELAGSPAIGDVALDHDAGSSEPEEPSPETSSVGKYQLIETLGRGGMGTIWRARHESLKRDVALKLLVTRSLTDASSRARFRREMEAVGRLNHPNVVQALDAGEVEGQPYLAMELLDGIDAAQRVRSDGPLPIPTACEVIRQASLGVEHAHRQGLLHRDIKPSNLMLSDEQANPGSVKVLDLGLARFAQPDAQDDTALTNSSHVLGTGDFVAPEQGLDPRAADERSDVYSLGCTLYFLLTGQAPFASDLRDTFGKKVLAHVQAPPPVASDERAEVPGELDAILRRAMAKVPDQRFSSAAELAQALSPFCQQQAPAMQTALPPAALAAPAPEKVGSARSALATPALVAAGTAAIMLILFGIALAAMPGLLPSNETPTDTARVNAERTPTEQENFDDTPIDKFSDAPVGPVVPDNEQRGKPVSIDWIYSEHEGQARNPAGILIHGQGFCFLSGVKGKFRGWGENVLVDLNEDNVWGVTGSGVEFGVDVKARAFSVETREPRPLAISINAYRWSPPDDAIRMLHKDEGLCVLTSFTGGLNTDEEFAGIELGEDGYYWLRGQSKDTKALAAATSILLSRERSLAAQVRTYRWPSQMHREPIRMQHQDEGICFLSLIRGPYSGPEDQARVYIGDDGFWYLSGGGPQSPVSCEAIAVRFTGTVVE